MEKFDNFVMLDKNELEKVEGGKSNFWDNIFKVVTVPAFPITFFLKK